MGRGDTTEVLQGGSGEGAADPTDPNVVCTLKGIELVWAEPHKTPDAIAQEFEAWCLVQFGPRQKAE
jgi:hypothetical protein